MINETNVTEDDVYLCALILGNPVILKVDVLPHFPFNLCKIGERFCIIWLILAIQL